MLIRDHLNLLGDSPLRGGPWIGCPSDRKFLDLSQAYDPFLMGLARDWAVVHTDLAGALREGVYAAVSGPNYETPAEIRMLRLLGADAVGMSTVAEVILSRMFECPVLGLSTMTNWGAGMKPGTVLDHDDVLAVTRRAAVAIGGLIDWLLPFLVGER
jgi:purine-nucleoside phosphorylase